MLRQVHSWSLVVDFLDFVVKTCSRDDKTHSIVAPAPSARSGTTLSLVPVFTIVVHTIPFLFLLRWLCGGYSERLKRFYSDRIAAKISVLFTHLCAQFYVLWLLCKHPAKDLVTHIVVLWQTQTVCGPEGCIEYYDSTFFGYDLKHLDSWFECRFGFDTECVARFLLTCAIYRMVMALPKNWMKILKYRCLRPFRRSRGVPAGLRPNSNIRTEQSDANRLQLVPAKNAQRKVDLLEQMCQYLANRTLEEWKLQLKLQQTLQSKNLQTLIAQGKADSPARVYQYLARQRRSQQTLQSKQRGLPCNHAAVL